MKLFYVQVILFILSAGLFTTGIYLGLIKMRKYSGGLIQHSTFTTTIFSCGVILAIIAAAGPSIIEAFSPIHPVQAEYTPFSSEKREIALTTAKDRPSEKDARALVELVKEAELRKVGLRAPEDHLVLSTEAWRDKDVDQALAHAFQGLALSQDDIKVKAALTLRIGTIYADMKKNNMAIDKYNTAISLDPSFPWPHYYLGNLNASMGKNKAAERAYKQAIKLDPGYAYAHNNLGNLYNKTGEHRLAVSAYKEALKLNPDYANGYYNLGIIYDKMGMTGDAERSYKEALRSDPKHAYALNNLGFLYDKSGRTAEALKAYKEALKHDPDHSNALYNLKNLNKKLGISGNSVRKTSSV